MIFSLPVRRRLALSSTALSASLVLLCLASAAFGQSRTPNAPNTSTALPGGSGQLQGLARATDTQLQISYRHDAEEHERRREQVAAAVLAWRAAGRSPANDQLLIDWLRSAIRKSMPGSREALPELPKFDPPVVARPAASTATPAIAPTSTTRQKTVVEKPVPMHGQGQMENSRVEQALSGHKSAEPAHHAAEAAAPESQKSGAARSAETNAQHDFWTAHPANKELPANLSGGDPFRDDP